MKSWRLLLAIAGKELRQIVRDRLTAALLIGVPLAQLLLFGYAIELRPKSWPTAWVSATYSQDIKTEKLSEKKLQESGWFKITTHAKSVDDAMALMRSGQVQFIAVWPEDAQATIERDEKPLVRLLADVSDPFANTALLAAQRSMSRAGESPLPVQVRVEYLYAPKLGTAEFLVPALAGVILTLTLTLLAALSIVREVERGTWEGLLTTPTTKGPLVFGKLLCYWAVGVVLFAVLISVAHFLFGTVWGTPALWLAALVFMLANLALGLTLSFLASTQMQAMQMGVFFYLPSILLSGFMFPLHAMPAWARTIGEVLPLTHFLRCLRAVLIKGADAMQVLQLAWPIALFALLALSAALITYQRRA